MAAAGATAALAGLVFVAVSINIERILAFRGLPERGLVTVLLLVSVLVVSLFGLVPGQSRHELGIELLVESIVAPVVMVGLILWKRPLPGQESHLGSSLGIVALGTVPFVVGAIGVLAQSGGGLYWTFSGMVGAIIGAVINAWILLVEILR